MRRFIYTLVLAAVGIFLFGTCKNEAPTTFLEVKQLENLYFNSFESSADTAGWWGYAQLEFRSDVPPTGGKQSLFVSGGCIVPHGAYSFINTSADGYIVLKSWGKSLIGGGSVVLRLNSGYRWGLSCSIHDTVWTLYRSVDSLFCKKNDTLFIEVMSGGIKPGAMLVDLIEVSKVQ
jgi:hypothetical protein